MEDCDFCRIVAGELPARIIYETAQTISFFPNHPATPGHTLVIPRLHVKDLWSIDKSQLQSVIQAASSVAKALRMALRPEGLNLINSAGPAASQTVMHFHVHLVPRWDGDRMGEFWPSGDCISEGRKDELVELVREACEGLEV